MKQAGLVWWKELQKSMKLLGFKHAQSNAGVFIYKAKNGDIVVAIIYVDVSLLGLIPPCA